MTSDDPFFLHKLMIERLYALFQVVSALIFRFQHHLHLHQCPLFLISIRHCPSLDG
ncbi:hypothetical protein BMETH_2512_0 [methanotrophic bacterial endosymbiont of Bathymodiolus sp.]|nr:hypothetical protein BMETH_2512_0 [methanotrophic bacterial endosymbiont of Bathymodiolus sp.]